VQTAASALSPSQVAAVSSTMVEPLPLYIQDLALSPPQLAAGSSAMVEPLPLYVQDQVPQSPFDMLLTRIAVPISTTHPDARTILESFVESQKAPAYNGPEKYKSHEPIDHYPVVAVGFITDGLMRVKQQIVKELFDAVSREDAEAIALLIQHNLVTANTTSETGQTPLLEAISKKNIAIVKELLDLGADCNGFGVVVSIYWLRPPFL
jgi:hypothetical protein